MYTILPWIAPFVLHPLVEYTLSRVYPSFLDHPRKLYIQKNVVKAIVLAILSPIVVLEGQRIFYRSVWNYSVLQQLTYTYGIVDGYSLVRFYNELSETTRVHHTIVSVFAILNYFITFDPWRQLMLFGGVSVLTFPVNLYLGLRFFSKVTWLRRLATTVYIPAILFNIWWQWKYMLMSPMYFGVVAMVLLDDFVLLRHLLTAR
jgi:hypothetical protein